MPVFLEEDGTGLSSATSYVSVGYADDYLGAGWAADNTAKEVALMSGTEYADLRWGPNLMSRPLLSTQGLEFPRLALYDRYGRQVEGIPDEWKKAVCLYAKEYVANKLYPIQAPSSAADIKKKKIVAGPITTEIEYLGAKPAEAWPTFQLADKFAKLFTYSGGGVMRN